MREPALGLKTSLLNGGSCLQRIGENLKSVWRLPWVPLPAANAPIHLLEENPRKTIVGAQAGSITLHLLAFGVLILAFTRWSATHTGPLIFHGGPIIEYMPHPAPHIEGPASLGRAGGGGDHNPQSPTAGNLAPLYKFELAPPRLPDGRVHPLPQVVTIFNADAPESVATVNELGLPWMPTKTDSAGPGPTGIGNTPGNSMGRNGPNGDGELDNPLAYNRVASQVTCRICPDPLYSDEARKTKLQGSVLLAVLVGADGRAKDVRVLRGLGMGLDENAIQAIRNWQFLPARDAGQHPVASWIKVETTFRLF